MDSYVILYSNFLYLIWKVLIALHREATESKVDISQAVQNAVTAAVMTKGTYGAYKRETISGRQHPGYQYKRDLPALQHTVHSRISHEGAAHFSQSLVSCDACLCWWGQKEVSSSCSDREWTWERFKKSRQKHPVYLSKRFLFAGSYSTKYYMSEYQRTPCMVK